MESGARSVARKTMSGCHQNMEDQGLGKIAVFFFGFPNGSSTIWGLCRDDFFVWGPIKSEKMKRL